LAAQTLSWHNSTSSSECIPRPEVHSTCNYCNCPFFFGVHIYRSVWSGSTAFTMPRG